MEFDLKVAQDFVGYINDVKEIINQNKDLVNSERLREVEKVEKEFSQATEDAQSENRKLRIGVIGDVKAGKSSFLNALFFNGEDILPKACTPMTAALTKISYDKKPHASIHFYVQDDWNDISSRSMEYDKRFNEAYDKYVKEIEAKNNKTLRQTLTADIRDLPKIPIKTKSEYKKVFDQNVDEILRGSKELVTMADKHADIISKLGQVDNIKGKSIKELTAQIDQYVGARGKYTPIVSYVELFIDSEDIDGLEIVDTPGLNDPVVSRGIVTKEFLSQCDAAVLLSPCTSFMPEPTVALMTCALPSANIHDMIVVGSKLDSGVLDNNSSKTFSGALKKSVNDYKEMFNETMNVLKKRDPSSTYITAIADSKVCFVSSMLFAISQKKENGTMLNDEEKKVIQNFINRWNDFPYNDPEKLCSLSGIDDVADILNDVKDHKNEIFEKESDELIKSYNGKLQRILNDIISDSSKKKLQIQKYDADDLRHRYTLLNDAINHAGSQLAATFDRAGSESCQTAARICSRIRNDLQNYNTPIKVKTETEEHTTFERCGWFNKDIKEITTHSTIHSASLSEGLKKFSDYIARCNAAIIDDYQNLFNFNKLCQEVKKIIIAPFSEKDDFNESDIQLSLEKLRSQISTPPIDAILLNDSAYADKLRSRFSYSNSMSSGDSSSSCTVFGEDVNRLSVEVSAILMEIQHDICTIVMNYGDKNKNVMSDQAVKFAQELKSSFAEDFANLSKQIQDKQNSVERYDRLISIVERKLNSILGLKEG